MRRGRSRASATPSPWIVSRPVRSGLVEERSHDGTFEARHLPRPVDVRRSGDGVGESGQADVAFGRELVDPVVRPGCRHRSRRRRPGGLAVDRAAGRDEDEPSPLRPSARPTATRWVPMTLIVRSWSGSASEAGHARLGGQVIDDLRTPVAEQAVQVRAGDVALLEPGGGRRCWPRTRSRGRRRPGRPDPRRPAGRRGGCRRTRPRRSRSRPTRDLGPCAVEPPTTHGRAVTSTSVGLDEAGRVGVDVVVAQDVAPGDGAAAVGLGPIAREGMRRAAAIAGAEVSGRSVPRSSPRSSGMPPTALAITGSPSEPASTRTVGRPSR